MRYGGGSLAEIFPAAGGLGREERRASVPDLPTPPWQSAVLGTRALERKAQEVGDAASRGSSLGDTGTRAGGPSFFCVGLELTSHCSGWLQPWGCGFGLWDQHSFCVNI